MRDALLQQPPPVVAGLALGLCVVAMYALLNSRLGVVGGFSDIVERLSERSLRIGARGTFVLGLVGGALVFTLLTGRGRIGDGYGWLTREMSDATAVAMLVFAGALIGYGTKTAGGCTSGNGLCGTATASPAAVVSTMTFMATAIAVSFATEWIWGA